MFNLKSAGMKREAQPKVGLPEKKIVSSGFF